jgi:hypothetical protein
VTLPLTVNGIQNANILISPDHITNATLMHEYGHFLSYQIFGDSWYYSSMAPASIFSAEKNNLAQMMGFPNNHLKNWTETGASTLAKLFFGPASEIANSTSYTSSACL